MRKELLYTPHLLLQRLAEVATKRARLRRLRGTCAGWLTHDHIDSLELIDLAAAAGARVFYDIGANVGSWSLLCRACVPRSSIVAFEPLPEHCEQFARNLQDHDNVSLLRFALGPKEETRPLLVTTNSDASSLLPVTREGAALWSLEVAKTVEVPVVTLDAIVGCKGLPLPNLIKLDVQGFELAVLQGATEMLKTADWVLSEVSFRPFYAGQVLFSELAGYLGARGFEVYAFGHSMRIGRPQDQVDVLFGRLRQNPK